MRICTTCNIAKEDTEYHKKKRKSGSYGLQANCKQCSSEKSKSRYINFTPEEKLKRTENTLEWRKNNRDAIRSLKAKYRLGDKIERLSSVPHDAHIKAYDQHMVELSVKHDQHVKDRMTFIRKRIYQRIKRGVQRGLKGSIPTSNWSDHKGYSMDDLIVHIEKQFVSGMGWHNMDRWHIDHIIPVKSFTFKAVDSTDFKLCYSLHNLRPLWAEDNKDKYHNFDKLLINKTKGTRTYFLSRG